MNILVSILTLKEFRRSIEQSTSTKHFTQFAYIFLSLSLSISVFEMNTVKLQNTQLWVFFAIANISLLISLVLWFMFNWVSRSDNIKNFIDIEKTVIILLKFSWIASFYEIILILFALCHSMISIRLILIHLDVWERFWDEEMLKWRELSLLRLLDKETS